MITEVALGNNSREFVEIYNAGNTAVDLGGIYLSDDEDYYRLPGAFGGSPTPNIGSFDFIIKFPDGASIGPGEVAVVAFRYQQFQDKFGVIPEFGIKEVPSGQTGSQMVDPETMVGVTGGIQLMSSDPQLTNGGEGVVLFYWDGQSDLVEDIDMFAAGEGPTSPNQLANKTGQTIDGPDTDSLASSYQTDVYTFTEVVGDAASGTSHKRIAREDGYENQDVGGNSVVGDDETSEDFAITWDSSPYSAPTPGQIPASLEKVCGDGVVNSDTGEECDDGGESPNCNSDCTIAACGDGVVNSQAGEECDDGNTDDNDSCRNTCRLQACGDGHVYGAEECDDGNTDDTDGCLSSCQMAECGDGAVHIGSEECDGGGDTATCDRDCTGVVCGDMHVNTAAGEQCEDGNSDNSDSCVDGCQIADCGDGYVHAGSEACDSGGIDTSSCNFDCTLADCGDGILNTAAGEVCDDGNNDDGDGCSTDCQQATCGDGHVQTGVEQCDDGNQQNDDSCVGACVDASCGDGYVYAGVEDCDADGVATATCDVDCTVPECGDGTVNPAAGEECDDGNDNNNDGCRDDCISASCDDFMQNVDEIDIDCGGHCGPQSCSSGQICAATSDCKSGLECVAGTCQVAEILVTGLYHTCALTSLGEVRCWGRNSFGQLGHIGRETVGDDELAAAASDVQVGGTATQLAAGYLHTCALLDDGSVRCWGNNSFGQLGYGHTHHVGDNETPASIATVDLGGTATQLAAGAYHTCALMSDGDVYCWGDNARGQLGHFDAGSSYAQMNMVGDNESPESAGAVAIGGLAQAVTAGAYHTCALLSDGTARCWGDNKYGQLGLGNTDTVGDNETPATRPALDFGAPIQQISAGMEHTCALLSGGAVRCWGRNTDGQLGYGNTDTLGDDEGADASGDVPIGCPAVRIVTGSAHTCALSTKDTLRCWGRNTFGQLGLGNTTTIGDDETPADLPADIDVGGSVILTSAGYGHTCVALTTGALRCWGYNQHGQLGHGHTATIGDDESPASAGDVSYE